MACLQPCCALGASMTLLLTLEHHQGVRCSLPVLAHSAVPLALGKSANLKEITSQLMYRHQQQSRLMPTVQCDVFAPARHHQLGLQHMQTTPADISACFSSGLTQTHCCSLMYIILQDTASTQHDVAQQSDVTYDMLHITTRLPHLLHLLLLLIVILLNLHCFGAA
jgi:hypothetical protein